jgi:endonuclease YncB( thermonuclease family)
MDTLLALKEYDCIPCIPLKDGAIVKVLRILDGDTLLVGFITDGIAQKMSLRMLGYDACEIHSKDLVEKQFALYAKQKMEEICTDKLIQLKTVKLEKFGRLLSDASVDGIESICDYMLQFKHCCKPYYGKHKEAWVFDSPPPSPQHTSEPQQPSFIPQPVRKLSHQFVQAIKSHF